MTAILAGQPQLPSIDAARQREQRRRRCSASMTPIPTATLNQRRKRTRTNPATVSISTTDSQEATYIRNPRSVFPVRDDFIRSAWVQRARTQRAQEYEELFPYFQLQTRTAVTSQAATSARAATVGVLGLATRHDQSCRLQSPATTAQEQQQQQQQRHKPQTVPHSATSAEHPARNQSHMGVGTGLDRVTEMRRAFRRLEPENMFRTPKTQGEPIWAYWGGVDGRRQQTSTMTKPRRTKTEGFVLIPAKHLAELRALEGALRHERSLLKAHCLLALNEGEVSAHRPLEVTRMAVHTACGREMTAALRDFRAWAADADKGSSGKNGSNRAAKVNEHGNLSTDFPSAVLTKPHEVGEKQMSMGKLARKGNTEEVISELQRMPPGWRPLRWKIIRQQRELRNQTEEITAMTREEKRQRITQRYVEAWERRHDYDLYCVLAGQFWPLSPRSFQGVDRPGRKLFFEVDGPARKIALMWKICYPFRKDRKRKACVAFQALWRGRRVRRRWRPVVKLRLKHGRRACVRPCFSAWQRLARVNRWARRRFDKIQGKWIGICFTAWVEWIAIKAEAKKHKLARAAKVLKNVSAYRSFRSLQTYVVATRRARRLFVRAVGMPALDAWIQYTQVARRKKERDRAAATVQRHFRGFRARARYTATRAIITFLDRLVAARRARRFLRLALAAGQRHATEELVQAGRDAEISAGLSREQHRLSKLQKDLKTVDTSVRRRVTRGWKRGWLAMSNKIGRLNKKGARTDGRRGLRAEIKVVRAEWKNAQAADTVARKNLDDRGQRDNGIENGASESGRGDRKNSSGNHMLRFVLGGVLENITRGAGFGGGRITAGLGSENGDDSNAEGRTGTHLSQTAPLPAGSAVGIGADQIHDRRPGFHDRGVHEKEEEGEKSGRERDRAAGRVGGGDKIAEEKVSTVVVNLDSDLLFSLVDKGATANRKNNGRYGDRPKINTTGTAEPTAANVGAATDTAAVEREAKRRIISREMKLAREIVTHDFEVSDPPPLKCCAPGCERTFTQGSHYLEHWAGASNWGAIPAEPNGKGNMEDRRHGASNEHLFSDLTNDRKYTSVGESNAIERASRTALGTGGVGRTTAIFSSSVATQSSRLERQTLQQPANKLVTASRGKTPSTAATTSSTSDFNHIFSAESGHPELGDTAVAKFHLALTTSLDYGGRDTRNQSRGKGGRAKSTRNTSSSTNGNKHNDEKGDFGLKLIKAYIRRIWGHGEAYNTLLMWSAVEAWRRRCATSDLSYLREALALRQRFIDPGAPKEATLPGEIRENVRILLDSLPDAIGHDVYDDMVSATTAGSSPEGRDVCGLMTIFDGDDEQLDDETLRGVGVRRSDGVDVPESGPSASRNTSSVLAAAAAAAAAATNGNIAVNRAEPSAMIASTTDKLVRASSMTPENSSDIAHSMIEQEEHTSRRKTVATTKGTAPPVRTTRGSVSPGLSSGKIREMAASSCPVIARVLRPTSFDEAQWQALAHLCRVVAPGFWASDLGRNYNLLRKKNLDERRQAAHEIVRIERYERLANEAREVKTALAKKRENYLSALAEPALKVIFDVVCEALIRSAAAAAEQLSIQELEELRETDMLAEAATVETAWAVEPSFLEDVLTDELEAFCAEKEELALMALEDNWISPELRPLPLNPDIEAGRNAAVDVVIDFIAIPGGEGGAAAATETIQRAWRQRSARIEARRRLAKAYVKRPAPGGGVYYEDTVTGTSQWERPLIATRLFPDSVW